MFHLNYKFHGLGAEFKIHVCLQKSRFLSILVRHNTFFIFQFVIGWFVCLFFLGRGSDFKWTWKSMSKGQNTTWIAAHVTCSQLIIFLVHTNRVNTCRKRHLTYYLSFPVTAMEMSALWACMGKICSYKSFDFFNVKLEMTSKLFRCHLHYTWSNI